MKIRTGFVSNSSSASFIVHWRYKTMGEEISFKKILSLLFNTMNYDDEKNDFKWEEWNEKFKEVFEEIEKKTKTNHDGSYTTSFFTSMYNDVDDFGKIAKSFVMATLINGVIIDTNIEEDY